MKAAKDVEAYIAAFPPEVRTRLASIRRTIRKAVPAAEEAIGYGMPAYRLHGPLVYFGAFKDHTSLFPASDGARRAFHRRLARFEGGKGTIRFPADEPLPLALIRDITKYRAKENLAAATAKAARKAKPRERKRAGNAAPRKRRARKA